MESTPPQQPYQLMRPNGGEQNQHNESEKNCPKGNTNETDEQVPVHVKGEANPIRALIFIFLCELGLSAWMLADYFASSPFIILSGILFFVGIVLVTGYGIHNVVKNEVFKSKYKKHTKWVWFGAARLLAIS